MKKTIIFAMMAAVLGFTACSKEEPAQTETVQMGMVLRATVEHPADSKAAFTDNEGVWHFNFAEGDIIKVTNSEIGYDNFYTFTYNGTDFVSTDAMPTIEPARWYAYFPSNDVSLVGQSGAWEDIADKYVMTGSTPYCSGDVTGNDGLSITMSPKVAILKIISQDNKGLDINVKTGANSWASGYKTSLLVSNPTLQFYSVETKQTLLNTTEMSTYYIAVPAGVQISIKDGDEVWNSTGENGLTAGKYYILPAIKGFAKKSDGYEVKWVQLWAGGPKFALWNIGAMDPFGYGGLYCWGGTVSRDANNVYCGDSELGDNDTATQIWGSNWRMPTSAEFEKLLNPDICSMEWKTNTGYVFTGKGDYSENSVEFPAAGYCKDGNVSEQGSNGYYWSSSSYGPNAYRFRFWSGYTCLDSNGKNYGYSVRAVLAE